MGYMLTVYRAPHTANGTPCYYTGMLLLIDNSNVLTISNVTTYRYRYRHCPVSVPVLVTQT